MLQYNNGSLFDCQVKDIRIDIERYRYNSRIDLNLFNTKFELAEAIKRDFGPEMLLMMAHDLAVEKHTINIPVPKTWKDQFKEEVFPKIKWKKLREWLIKKYPVQARNIKVEGKKMFPFINRKLSDRELGQGFITIRVLEMPNEINWK